mmetsp:Transcript_11921/g.25609  ORF Transcript_11921/g.25609 Transcript_11921/m.25609 type:complete len:98 (-) Transcript_11921:407-700(-)
MHPGVDEIIASRICSNPAKRDALYSCHLKDFDMGENEHIPPANNNKHYWNVVRPTTTYELPVVSIWATGRQTPPASPWISTPTPATLTGPRCGGSGA